MALRWKCPVTDMLSAVLNGGAFDEAPVVRYPNFKNPFYCIPMHLSLAWELC